MEKDKMRLARMHHGAGYKLHEDVKCPTTALLRASQIGVLSHDEPSMAEREDKDALLVVSYGAARQESRRAAVEPEGARAGAPLQRSLRKRGGRGPPRPPAFYCAGVLITSRTVPSRYSTTATMSSVRARGSGLPPTSS